MDLWSCLLIVAVLAVVGAVFGGVLDVLDNIFGLVIVGAVIIGIVICAFAVL